jgi:hypothetical protein
MKMKRKISGPMNGLNIRSTDQEMKKKNEWTEYPINGSRDEKEK